MSYSPLVIEWAAPCGVAARHRQHYTCKFYRWLWRRLLPEGSTLVAIDLRVADVFWNNKRPLVDKGFLTVHDGRPSRESLFDLDPTRPFDLVYVDGSHEAPHVLGDVVMADALLAVGGLLVLDDFEWAGVARASRAFWEVNRERYDVLHVLKQVVLRKKAEPV